MRKVRSVRSNLIPSTHGSRYTSVLGPVGGVGPPAASFAIFDAHTIVADELAIERGELRRSPSHLILQLDIHGLQFRYNGELAIAAMLTR